MLERKIVFLHMEPTSALEEHANQRLDKVAKLLEHMGTPQVAEVHLKCNPHGKHHEVDILLASKDFKVNVQAQDAQMYLAVDSAVDKLIELVKKHREKQLDSVHKPETSKKEFFNK